MSQSQASIPLTMSARAKEKMRAIDSEVEGEEEALRRSSIDSSSSANMPRVSVLPLGGSERARSLKGNNATRDLEDPEESGQEEPLLSPERVLFASTITGGVGTSPPPIPLPFAASPSALRNAAPPALNPAASIVSSPTVSQSLRRLQRAERQLQAVVGNLARYRDVDNRIGGVQGPVTPRRNATSPRHATESTLSPLTHMLADIPALTPSSFPFPDVPTHGQHAAQQQRADADDLPPAAITSPLSPSTPRRSRLARAFGSSPGSPNSPRTPRTQRGQQNTTSPTRTPTTSSRWSSALHAILSPSPSLPRTFSPTSSPSAPSPRASSLFTFSPHFLRSADVSVHATSPMEWQAHELRAVVESTRRAQAELLHALKARLREDLGVQVGQNDLKETILFLAQCLTCGLRLPDSDDNAEAFFSLHTSARSLIDTFDAVRTACCGSKSWSGIARELSARIAPLPVAGITSCSVLLGCLSEEGSATCQVAGVQEGGWSARDEGDVFQNRPESTQNDAMEGTSRLNSALLQLVESSQRFGKDIRAYDAISRSTRRAKRLERRNNRLAKVSALYGLSIPPCSPPADPSSPSFGLPSNAERLDIATFSSQELLSHALQRAMSEKLFTLDDVETFDPRLLLTLPRLAILYGVQESSFPILPSYTSLPGFATPPSHPAGTMPSKEHVDLLEVFLPRLCRPVPHEAIRSVRRMEANQVQTLAKRLAVWENPSSSTDGPELVGPDTEGNEAEIQRLFRIIAAEADGSSTAEHNPNIMSTMSPPSRHQHNRPLGPARHVKLMKRVLKLHLVSSATLDGQEAGELDDEVALARAFLILAGLG